MHIKYYKEADTQKKTEQTYVISEILQWKKALVLGDNEIRPKNLGFEASQLDVLVNHGSASFYIRKIALVL